MPSCISGFTFGSNVTSSTVSTTLESLKGCNRNPPAASDGDDMKRPTRCAVLAGVVLLWPAVSFPQQLTLFKINPNDPVDHKAVVALVRGARAAQLDTHDLRLATTNA